MGGRPRPFVLAILLVGVLFLLVGASIGVLCASRTIDNEYGVDIRTPAGLDWTVSIPRASLPMSLALSGSVRSVEPIDTPFGPMENVTGTGSVQFVWGMHRVLYWRGPLIDDMALGNLSGRDGVNFHIWRGSANPNINIEISGSLRGHGSTLGAMASCFGPGFQGGLAEGWNLLPVGFGDCTLLIDMLPWYEIVFPGLVSVGAGLIGVSVPIRFRRGVRT